MCQKSNIIQLTWAAGLACTSLKIFKKINFVTYINTGEALCELSDRQSLTENPISRQ